MLSIGSEKLLVMETIIAQLAYMVLCGLIRMPADSSLSLVTVTTVYLINNDHYSKHAVCYYTNYGFVLLYFVVAVPTHGQ